MPRDNLQNVPSNTASSRRSSPKGYVRSDERIFEDLCEALTQQRDVDVSQVWVTVKGGTVTLEGRVPSGRDKYRIEEMAEATRGAREVENRVRVTSAQTGPDGEVAIQHGIFGMLAQEHRGVAAQFAQLATPRKPGVMTRAELFDTLAQELLSHAHAEQDVLYAALAPLMPAEVRKAREEHHLVEHLIEEMDTQRADEGVWQAKLEVLQSLFEQHVREEEGDFFLTAARALDPQKADALKPAYVRAKEQYMNQFAQRRGRARGGAVVTTKGSSGSAEPMVGAQRPVSEGGRSARK